MNSFQKNTLFLTLLLCGFVGVAGTIFYIYHSHEVKLAADRKAWNKENIRNLEGLSRIGALSSDEQDRLDRAGDDVDHIQQVLLELHTERHTLWLAHKSDADDRARRLQSASYLASYDHDGEYREVAVQLRKDRAEIAENLAGYEQGYIDLKAWHPISFEVFQVGATPGALTPTLVYKSPKSTAQVLTSEPQSDQSAPLVRTVDETPPQTVPANGPSYAQDALDNVDVGVASALKSWAAAMESNDPERISSCYGEHVDRYFLKLDLDNRQVRQYVTEWLGREANQTTSFEVKDVTFENETATTAKIRLVKNTSVTGSSGTKAQVIRSRLYLTKFGTLWKITSEQDFKN